MKAAVTNIHTLNKTQAVPFTHLIPDTSANKHFYKNGLSKLIPRLTLKVYTDMEKCFSLWEAFSPKETLFDEWDVRYSFYQGFKYKPHFYTIYEGRKALGILPLWFNELEKSFEFFGGWWIEGTSFFVTDEHLVDFFMAILPTPVKLWSLRKDQPFDRMKVFGKVQTEDDMNYFKNIDGLSSIDSLMKEYKKKDRHNINADYQRMRSYGVRLEVVDKNKQAQLQVLEKMFDMNKKRFINTPDKSTFEQEGYRTAFRQLVKNVGSYDVKFFVAKIQKHIAAIDMVITHNDTYYQFQGVNDIKRFNGIGNYMVYVELKDAIDNGYKMVDCLQEDHSWKHRYFDKVDRFCFTKDK